MLPPRENAIQLLAQYIENENLRRHCEMVAQVMEAFGQRFNQDSELWYQTGLLHDLDWEKFPVEHPNMAVNNILTEYPAEMLDGIRAHAPSRTGKEPEQLIERYLFATDELTGFMHALSLLRPTGFEGMQPKSVKKKLKDKSFAANVSREDIARGFELIETTPEEHMIFMIEVFNRKA